MHIPSSSSSVSTSALEEVVYHPDLTVVGRATPLRLLSDHGSGLSTASDDSDSAGRERPAARNQEKT